MIVSKTLSVGGPLDHGVTTPTIDNIAQLAASATPLRLALRARGLGFALAARATRSRLGLRPRGSRYALAARATRLRLVLHDGKRRNGIRR